MTVPTDGTDVPQTINKYEAKVKPQGDKLWNIQIDEVVYFVVAPTEVYSKTNIVTATFTGTEAECRAEVKDRLRTLVADRDAIANGRRFKLTEDDIV